MRKPKIDPLKTEYQNEIENNEAFFNEVLKKARPDIWTLMDLMDTTEMNYYVLFKIIRQLNNVALGTGWGKVIVEVENGIVTFIRGEDSDRVGENIIIKKEQ